MLHIEELHMFVFWASALCRIMFLSLVRSTVLPASSGRLNVVFVDVEVIRKKTVPIKYAGFKEFG